MTKNIFGDVTLMEGDSLSLLKSFPENTVDTVLTSPPYWNQRKYTSGGLGEERTPGEFVDALLAITSELHRVLKDTGSFWLNLGDSYNKKGLAGVPWRVAIRMIDEQGWVLRNEVVWNKSKGGMDPSRDRLANTHELLFHFVKRATGYYYDVDAIRTNPRDSKIVNGAVVSTTGVSGSRYFKQIENSTLLSGEEKINARRALEGVISDLQGGRISDFRMVIRGQQRVTHSDQTKVSGRAKELLDKGYYFLKYHPKGSKPGDVWTLSPESAPGRSDSNFAAYPVELCLTPILATCPEGGTVLDPFCGTGTTLVAASRLKRRAIGIDISADYLATTRRRLLETVR